MYSIFLLITASALLLYTLSKLHFSRTSIFITFSLTILIFYFVVNPRSCMDSALQGAELFIKAVLPSLFPFLVICNLLIAFDGIAIYSKLLGPVLCKPLRLSKNCSFAIVASMLCGYPLGAKYSAELYSNGYIDEYEFKRLLNIASNAGPIFILGSVASSMLNNIYYGYIILAANYLSFFVIGLLSKNKTKTRKFDLKIKHSSINIGEAFKLSINDAINGTLMVGGYVIIFAVLISIIKNNAITSIISSNTLNFNINRDFLSALLLGSLDLTNGCNIITSSSLTITIKLCLISFFCCFGGFSIIAQTHAFFYKYKVSLKRYFMTKVLQGLIGVIITLIICILFINSIPTFSSNNSINYTQFWIPYLIFMIITIISLSIKSLFDAT
ncbi:sporulation integral membrane protein YlbJ [Clostridium sp. C8-1-8]|uniref:sporulation integral membrane protein YlbJ n=1 Tax=Clostridium sp. C8-1-8 TaxID=2698831 RepID=UPI001367D7D0|nr:sporulation integral membrane protein YlbJ [Clostridium sp. C8-1-8]